MHSGLDIAVMLFMASLIVVGARSLPRLWRHDFRGFDSEPSWWPWGEQLWRGYVRSMPLGWSGAVVLLIGWAVAPFVPESGGLGFSLTPWFVVPLLVLLFGSIVLILLVVLVNWPKWPVPPHLRGESGALRAWLRRREN